MTATGDWRMRRGRRRPDKPATLSAAFVMRVTENGRYGDGRGGYGLALRVRMTKNGRISKTWHQTVRLPNGKRTLLGLGKYPTITLGMARRQALLNVGLIAQGIDPRRKAAGQVRTVPTLAEAVDSVIDFRLSSWKDAELVASRWRAVIRDHAGDLANRPVDSITAPEVREVIMGLLHSKRNTADRLRHILTSTFAWAQDEGWCSDNPAERLGKYIPKRSNGSSVKHFDSVSNGEVAMMLRRVEADNDAHESVKLCLRLIALTAVRSNEGRGATWDEIDMAAKVWTIPAARMKGGREHRVPLSEQALDVLRRSWELRGDSDLVFPSVRGKVHQAARLNGLTRKHGDSTTHGLRASFRDWCAENGIDSVVANVCLAHRVGGQVEQAYLRSGLDDQRRSVMERWGQYITKEA